MRIRPIVAALGVAFAVTAQLAVTALPAAAYTLISDIHYVNDSLSAHLLDVYEPQGSGPFAAVFVIHGGGWIDGEKTDWANEAIKLTDAGFVAVAPNYRLAPENLFPAAIDDLQTAVTFIRGHAAEYSIDPARIGALGGSTGGNLASLLGTKGSGSTVTGNRIAAVASWSGTMNLITYDSGAERWLGCKYRDCPGKWKSASPLYNVDSSDAPMYIANGTTESVPLEQPTSMAHRLQRKDVPYVLRLIEGPKHSRGFEHQVWDETVAFLHQYLG